MELGNSFECSKLEAYWVKQPSGVSYLVLTVGVCSGALWVPLIVEFILDW